jgi:hypothetical protein
MGNGGCVLMIRWSNQLQIWYVAITWGPDKNGIIKFLKVWEMSTFKILGCAFKAAGTPWMQDAKNVVAW